MDIKLSWTSAGLALGTAAISASCFAADFTGWYAGTAWYAGVNVGQAKAHFNESDLNHIFASQGLTASSTVDNINTGGKLWGGYRFNPHFAIEGGYVNLGKFTFHSTISAFNGFPVTGTATGNVTARYGVFADAVGIVPLPADFSIFGKLGAYNLKTELNTSATVLGAGTTTINNSHTGGGWEYGAGVTYDFTRNFGARLEWERFSKVVAPNIANKTDVDLLSVGLIYMF